MPSVKACQAHGKASPQDDKIVCAHRADGKKPAGLETLAACIVPHAVCAISVLMRRSHGQKLKWHAVLLGNGLAVIDSGRKLDATGRAAARQF